MISFFSTASFLSHLWARVYNYIIDTNCIATNQPSLRGILGDPASALPIGYHCKAGVPNHTSQLLLKFPCQTWLHQIEESRGQSGQMSTVGEIWSPHTFPHAYPYPYLSLSISIYLYLSLSIAVYRYLSLYRYLPLSTYLCASIYIFTSTYRRFNLIAPQPPVPCTVEFPTLVRKARPIKATGNSVLG